MFIFNSFFSAWPVLPMFLRYGVYAPVSIIIMNHVQQARFPGMKCSIASMLVDPALFSRIIIITSIHLKKTFKKNIIFPIAMQESEM